ncbi:MAG TPA: hypothetical protein VF759_09880 [Allosphingosinicella sp.]
MRDVLNRIGPPLSGARRAAARKTRARIFGLLPLFTILALTACAKESQPADIEAALRACGVEGAKITRRDNDGSQSPFEVDLGDTESGDADGACMNGQLQAAGLRPVLTFYRNP